jgi:hypothetical protein
VRRDVADKEGPSATFVSLPRIFAGRAERWEHQERGDYNMERFDREFSDRLYSEKGREILRAEEQGANCEEKRAHRSWSSRVTAEGLLSFESATLRPSREYTGALALYFC